MAVHQASFAVRTRGRGLVEITQAVAREVSAFGVKQGITSVFCLHTSCSLVIMENADPSARADLEAWMNRLVPDGGREFAHTAEGPDDMPSHIKMALTRTGETIPVANGRLVLGTWQGIYLWEHRTRPHSRTIAVTVVG